MARPRNLALVGLLLASACKRAPEPATQVVPAITAPVTIDGEWDEPDWTKLALRGQLVGDDGALARPSSEARFLRDHEHLYIGLFAADDDIRSTDAFDVTVGSLALHVTAAGVVSPAVAGVRAAVDRDGSLDDSSNYDEEWLLELALPIAALGSGSRHAVSVARCDTPKAGGERCAHWSAMLQVTN